MTFHFTANFYPSKPEYWLSKAYHFNRSIQFCYDKRLSRYSFDYDQSWLRILYTLKNQKLSILVQPFWIKNVYA